MGLGWEDELQKEKNVFIRSDLSIQRKSKCLIYFANHVCGNHANHFANQFCLISSNLIHLNLNHNGWGWGWGGGDGGDQMDVMTNLMYCSGSLHM